MAIAAALVGRQRSPSRGGRVTVRWDTRVTPRFLKAA